MKNIKSGRRDFLASTMLVLGATGLWETRAAAGVITSEVPPTWVSLNGKIYGAKPDATGPIGGGQSYTRIVTKGDYEVDSFEALIDALGKARAGQTVLITGETEIDLTADVYIHDFALEIPEGVTLAGNRGQAGSQGALITSDALKTPVMIKVLGPNARITGIRLRGPNPKRYMRHHKRAFSGEKLGSEYYYKFPTSNGIVCDHAALEVDNCEISAFGHAGIYLRAGSKHHIHHNYIHHCQYHGLGYGISHSKASSVIEFNNFDSNRHSIAGTGSADSEYIARHNVELGVASSHCFDMHGGRDRKDGTNIAGRKMAIYNNTFGVPDQYAVVVRGEPVETCIVNQNWFPHHQDPKKVVRGEERTKYHDNLFGVKEQEVK